MVNSALFKKILFESYIQLSNNSAGIVAITDLREKVSIIMLRNSNEIFTENQFDKMLRTLPLEGYTYMISLGNPMGANEKLFHYKGDYFKTIFIKFLKKGY